MTVPPPNYVHLLKMSEAMSKCLGVLLSEAVDHGHTKAVLGFVDLQSEYRSALQSQYPEETQSPEAVLSPDAFANRIVADALKHFASIKVAQFQEKKDAPEGTRT